MEIAECDDLDQVEQRRRFFAADHAELSVEFTPDGANCSAEALLLVVAAGIEIFAVGRAGNAPGDALRNIGCKSGRSGPDRNVSLALRAIDTLAHFLG